MQKKPIIRENREMRYPSNPFPNRILYLKMKRTYLLSAALFMAILPGSFNTLAAQATSGLNPAHGAPGHRCDIAVGAPLNSAPAPAKAPIQNLRPGQPFPGMLANPAKSATSSKPVVNTAPAAPVAAAPQPVKTAAAAPAATKVTAGLNPPHGQPNHRCDIAVGAPLNSPAGKPAVAPVQTATPLQTGPVKNAAGVKINPPHGQPGHDCSVEVGKPLKQ
jgi:hypothetical protein